MCRVNRVPISFKYMRNKPTVITLKTPSFENRDGAALVTTEIHKNTGDNIAEEGRAGIVSPKNKDLDQVGLDDTFISSEGDECHPIIGTTRTSSESLTVGRPLEVF